MAQLIIAPFLLLTILSSFILSPSSASATPMDGDQIFLPQVFLNWPPTPTILTINPIDNADQDNIYTISWTPGENIDTYLLDESLNPDFPAPVAEYQLNSLSWSTDTGKFPGTYYYRIKGINQYNSGVWSNTQSITVYPLFVGLNIRFDGNGYIRGSQNETIGYHETHQVNALTDSDTIRKDSYAWYDPNPENFTPSTWSSYYSPTTGQFKTSSVPPDPSWKWNADSLVLPYGAKYSNAATILLGEQKFTVTGPIDGYTTYAQPIKYWQFINQEKFLYYDDNGDWKEYVNPGDIILRYDAGASGLILFDSVLRRYYNKNVLTSDTVQYITTLTSSNALLGSPAFSPSELNQGGLSTNSNGMLEH